MNRELPGKGGSKKERGRGAVQKLGWLAAGDQLIRVVVLGLGFLCRSGVLISIQDF